MRKDVVLLDRWSVNVQPSYHAGDIVTLWSPSVPKTLSCKRIIALEGDIVTTLPPYPEKKVLMYVHFSAWRIVVLMSRIDRKVMLG